MTCAGGTVALSLHPYIIPGVKHVEVDRKVVWDDGVTAAGLVVGLEMAKVVVVVIGSKLDVDSAYPCIWYDERLLTIHRTIRKRNK